MILLFTVATVSGQSIRFRSMSLTDARKLSEKENKLIFVDCYTVWCKPCKKMMNEVFSKSVVGRWFNSQFINLRLDMERGWGLEVKEQYDVRFYPTFLFLNSKGEVVHKFSGYIPEKDFLFESEKSLLRGMGLKDLTMEYEEGNRDPEFLKKYFDARKLAHDLDFQQVSDYLDSLTDEELDRRDNMRLVFEYAIHRTADHLDFDGAAFRHMMNKSERYKRYFDEEKVDFRLAYITLRKCGEAIRKEDPVDFERTTQVLKRWESIDFLQNRDESGDITGSIQTFAMTGPLKMTYFLQTGDQNAFEKAEIEYIEKIRHKPVQLDQLARMYFDWFEDPIQLTKAELWSQAAIELDSRRPDFYTTLGYIQYRKGEVESARNTVEKGIDLGKRLGEEMDDAYKLLAEIKQAQIPRSQDSP